METLLYFAKINVFITIFYITYWLLFRNHTFFAWNRFYLLGSLILASLLPAITFTETYTPEIVKEVYTAPTLAVSPIAYQQTQEMDWMTIILIGYAVGAALMLGRMAISFYKLFVTIQRGERIETDDYTLVIIDQKQVGSNTSGSFSFFKWLIISRNDYEHNPDLILRHEYVHIRQLHSIDILLIEFFKFIFWVNPVVWLYKNAMQATHEFLADQPISDREEYASFLVSYALDTP